MTAKLVPTVRTTYSKQEVIKAFVDAWFEMYGEIPKKESIGVLYAQNALETGFTTSMWNNNIGNVKYIAHPGDDESIEYCMLKNVYEYVHGKKVYFQPPHPATWFRSFPTLKEGVFNHFDFLKNHRYKAAWDAVEEGDPAKFSHMLKIRGYYTAPEATYTKAVVAHFNVYMRSKYYENATADLNKIKDDIPVTKKVVQKITDMFDIFKK